MVDLGLDRPERPSECAREAAAVEFDRLQHLASLADAHAAFVGDVPVPDGALGVEADAVGDPLAEVRPDPAVGEAAVVCDVERGEPLCVGLGDDQRRVVGRHEHAVGEGDAVGHLAGRAIRGD